MRKTKILNFDPILTYNRGRMSRKTYYREYEPERCWVGERQKICYATEDEAIAAARVAEHDYQISGLSVYKCEYGDHWHLSSRL